MASLTPALALSKPQVNGPETENRWGDDLNTNFDKIDAWTGPLPARIAALEAIQVEQGPISEAPNDGQTYGRHALGWSALALTHTIPDVSGLQAALVLKAPLDSPALTGVPTAPTAATTTNNTQLATTAFVKAVLSTAVGGTVTEAPNDGKTYGRKGLSWSVLDLTWDWTEIVGKPATFPPAAHTHAISDVSGLQGALDAKAGLSSPAFNGFPTGGTPGLADSSGILATTYFVQAQGYATATYVNNSVAPKVNRTGDSMTGALYVTPSSASDYYALYAYTLASPGAGIIGYGPGQAVYGMVGANQGAVNYTLYGNGAAFVPSGAWEVSDGVTKVVTGDVSQAKALAAVNAIPVKEYQAVSPEAREYIYGAAGDEALYGWIAQDVEPILPIAVRDIALPPDDKRSRAIAKGSSIKAINDRYMLTMLWAAVQRLSAEVDALKMRGA